MMKRIESSIVPRTRIGLRLEQHIQHGDIVLGYAVVQRRVAVRILDRQASSKQIPPPPPSTSPSYLAIKISVMHYENSNAANLILIHGYVHRRAARLIKRIHIGSSLKKYLRRVGFVAKNIENRSIFSL